MKKTMLVLVIILYTGLFHLQDVKAPTSGVLPIFYSEAINPFLKSWNAVCMEESRMDSTAYNSKDPHGGSHGISQIGTKRLNEYNNLTGKNYTIKDLYNVSISKEIYMYYAQKYGPYQIDLIIRRWNGSGSVTFDYLKRVKVYYND